MATTSASQAPVGLSKRGGYSGGKPARTVAPPRRQPSQSIRPQPTSNGSAKGS